MATPQEILDTAFRRASENLQTSQITDDNLADKLNVIAENKRNRAVMRLVLTCSFVRVLHPELDPRQPYTKIGSAVCFSGRKYDTRYIGPFIVSNELPCNRTTAFLTSALRNINRILTPELRLEGRPAVLYENALLLLDAIYNGTVEAENILAESIRLLIIRRDNTYKRIATRLALRTINIGQLPLATEQIIALISQHLQSKHASRLPVLLVAAAFRAAEDLLESKPRPLHAHNAADAQTGAVGDVEIINASNKEHVEIGFEMKLKAVTENDIDDILPKIRGQKVQKYIFITTAPVKAEVKEYAAACYKLLGGIEVTVLDCVEFIRYFLHLFYNRRNVFLSEYEQLLMTEPESAVSQDLKEKWLDLRRSAEKH